MNPRKRLLNLGKRSWRNLRRCLLATVLTLAIAISGWLLVNLHGLRVAANGPVDAYFVLGGSINREIYVARVAKHHPNIPILISQGSQDPCILLIFQQAAAPVQGVWLEKCAMSTFENFYFSLPILRQWGVRKVMLISSGTHFFRAKLLAQILLGSHAIWVEAYSVKERGVPGNKESLVKTSLDVTRALVWAVLSQFYQPRCSAVISLSEVEMNDWQEQGFVCEHHLDFP